MSMFNIVKVNVNKVFVVNVLFFIFYKSGKPKSLYVILQICKLVIKMVGEKAVEEKKIEGKKTGIKKAEGTEAKVVVEKTVNEKVETKVEKAVNGKAEERKAEEKKTENKTVEKIVREIEKKLKETLKTIDIEDVREKVEELERIEKKIEELNDRRMEIMDSIITTIETVDVEMFKTLKALGINGITDVILKAHEIVRKAMNEFDEETKEEKPRRVRRGEGIGKRRINFKGRVYNIAQYFLKKHGITGGLEGLKKWAEERGYKVDITDDMIIIN